jgi:hypothetical protein
MTRATIASFTAAAALLAGAGALAQNAVPPVVPDEGDALVEGEREIDPATYDSFSDWLVGRGPIPGIGTGGFLASEMIERELRARNGDTVGRVVDVALDDRAQARVFVVRLDDDSLRAVPVKSVMVSDADRLFTELTPAQVHELARVARPSG